MLNQHLQKAKSFIQQNQNNLLIFTLVIILFLSNFGLGMTNILPASFLIILYCIIRNPNLNYPKTITTYLSFGFLFLFNLSFLFSQTPYGFYEFIGFNSAILLFLNFSHNPLNLKSLSPKLTILTSFVSIFSIFNLITGPTDRTFGFFRGVENYITYPNAFADWLIFINLLSFAWVYSHKEKFSKSIYIPIIINLIAFWLTLSRGAYISFIIGIVIASGLIILSKKNVKKIFNLSLVLMLSIPLAFAINTQANFSNDILARVTSEDISANKSTAERPLLWRNSLSIIKDYPLFGSGASSFQYIAPNYQTKLLSSAPHPHNLFLKIASENGIFTSLLMLFLIIASSLSPLLKKQYEHIYLLPIVLSISAHHLIDYNLNFPAISFIFFASLGALAWQKNQSQNSNSKILKLLVLVLILISTTQFVAFTQIKKAESNQKYYLQIASLAPFPHQFYEAPNVEVPTIKYPNFHPILFKQAKAELQKDIPDPQFIQKAIVINALNDLEYHFVYLETLQKLKNKVELKNKELYYFDLINQYNDLLKINTYNTVTTANPINALSIVEFYLGQPEITNNDWATLKTDLQYTYQLESQKFQNRFNTL